MGDKPAFELPFLRLVDCVDALRREWARVQSGAGSSHLLVLTDAGDVVRPGGCDLRPFVNPRGAGSWQLAAGSWWVGEGVAALHSEEQEDGDGAAIECLLSALGPGEEGTQELDCLHGPKLL